MINQQDSSSSLDFITKASSIAPFTEVEDHEHNSDESRTCEHRARIRFPFLLYQIIEGADLQAYSEICSWQPHGRAFRVHDPIRFQTEIMSQHFQKKTRFASFQRQLRIYGFTRLTRESADAGAYCHDYFLRGRQDLLPLIRRHAVNGNRVRKASHPELQPDFRQMPPMPISTQDSLIPSYLAPLWPSIAAGSPGMPQLPFILPRPSPLPRLCLPSDTSLFASASRLLLPTPTTTEMEASMMLALRNPAAMTSGVAVEPFRMVDRPVMMIPPPSCVLASQDKKDDATLATTPTAPILSENSSGPQTLRATSASSVQQLEESSKEKSLPDQAYQEASSKDHSTAPLLLDEMPLPISWPSPTESMMENIMLVFDADDGDQPMSAGDVRKEEEEAQGKVLPLIIDFEHQQLERTLTNNDTSGSSLESSQSDGDDDDLHSIDPGNFNDSNQPQQQQSELFSTWTDEEEQQEDELASFLNDVDLN